MIILPPEERKPSRLLKWTFRLLMAVVVMFCLFLFMLKTLSGTTESHRRGLEQAMSDIFKSQVSIGKLTTFNLFPQFVIEMERVHAQRVGGSVFDIKDLRLAFSLSDILFKRDNVEDIKITNLEFSPGVLGEQPVLLTSVVIAPESPLKQPSVSMKGLYGARPFTVDFGIKQVSGMGRVRYEVPQENPFLIVSGPFRLTGIYQQNEQNQPVMEQVQLSLNDEKIAEGRIIVSRDDKTTKFAGHFKAGGTTGVLTTSMSLKDQEWVFETLDLADIYGDASLRARLLQAWHMMPGADVKSSAPLVSKPATSIGVQVQKATGVVSGETIQGRFMSSDDSLSGWINGTIQSPDSKTLECGLVELKGDDAVLKTGNLPLLFAGSSMKAKLTLEEKTGAVKFTVEKTGKEGELFGFKPEALLTHQEELYLKEAPACAKALGLETKKDVP